MDDKLKKKNGSQFFPNLANEVLTKKNTVHYTNLYILF